MSRFAPCVLAALRCGVVLGAIVALSSHPPAVRCAFASESDEHAEGGPRTFAVEELESFGVRVATAGPGEVDVGIELPGEVRADAERIAHVAPRFPGIAREVRKRVGDRVEAGEVLAVIESDSLASYEVKAAFDAAVIDRHVAPGEAVSPERPIFVVADLSTVWVDIDVHQKALSRLRLGQPVRIAATQGSVETLGKVSYVAPVVDQATRTATARVVLPNPDGLWRPGLFVTATVLDPVAAPVVVQRRALQRLGGRTVVFAVEGDRFAVRPVTVGEVGRTLAEITAGLSAGERYADERAFLVKAELAKGEAGHED